MVLTRQMKVEDSGGPSRGTRSSTSTPQMPLESLEGATRVSKNLGKGSKSTMSRVSLQIQQLKSNTEIVDITSKYLTTLIV